MLVALDLTARQAARVLAQAVRGRAKLEIEPRPEAIDAPLWCCVESRDQDTLTVTLVGGGPDRPLPGLIGAMCDVRTVLAGQLYLFSTLIVDASDSTAPRRLTLAIPDVVQVANRRRFARKAPTEPIPVRISVPGHADTFIGTLANISRTGLACRSRRQELEDVLLIGDEVTLEFVLPWVAQVHNLPGVVCLKATDHDHLLVGFEFAASTVAAGARLELLRSVVESETERLLDEEEPR